MKHNAGKGDKGTTSVIGRKCEKTSPRIEAYGAVDELNSYIGLVRSLNPTEIDPILEKIQNDLFSLGAELAGSGKAITEKNVKYLENTIDKIESQLKPLKKFILPGGSQTAALLHITRAVCRRAERRVVTLKKEKINLQILAYLNRLSDLLFVLARWVNQLSNIPEVTWDKE